LTVLAFQFNIKVNGVFLISFLGGIHFSQKQMIDPTRMVEQLITRKQATVQQATGNIYFSGI
jgi:hypothetical protein